MGIDADMFNSPEWMSEALRIVVSPCAGAEVAMKGVKIGPNTTS